MKNSLIAIFIIISSISYVQAGEIYWLTDIGMKSRTDCIINQHSHNDNSQIHEYWVDCGDNNIEPLQTGPVTGNSTIYFDGVPILTCKIDASTFGRNDNFYMLLDCRQPILVFKDNFERSN